MNLTSFWLNKNSTIRLVEEFLGAFFGEDEPIYLRAFKAKGAPESPTNSPRKFSITRTQLASDPAVWKSLCELNRERGIYFVVNAGGQTKASINRINAFFAESDSLSKEDQHRLLDTVSVKPSIRVETQKSVHAYWLNDGPCSVEEWEQFQLSLISYLSDIGLQADASIKDPSRVMRLPGFDHLTYRSETGEYERVRVRIIEYKPAHKYSLGAMKQKFAKASNSVFEVGVSKDLPDQILDGQGRTREIVSLAGTLNSRGVTAQEMLAMLRVVNEQRCVPPLTDEKLESIVNSVSNYESANPIHNTRKKENLTDLGNARRLVRLHGDDLRYDSERCLWLAWNGIQWVEDAEADAMRLAKEVPATMIAEAAGLKDEERTALIKGALRAESAKSLRAMLDLAKSEREIAASVEDFDSQHHLLNVLNGTINLRTGKLQEHRREDMITKVVPIAYGENALAPVFEAFLDRIFAGNRSLMDFVQRACGYSLTGETGEQCIFILYGTGANGKSTLIEVLAAATGEFAAHVRTEALIKHKNTSAGGASEDIAELRGARFVSAVETNVGQQLAEGLLKQITGQDRVKARRLYGHNIEFRPTFKLWLACNDKPEIGGTDHAIWRRIHLIPFDVTIPEKEREKRILDKLKGELPGILNWFILGASEYYRQGLNVPAEVKSATESYKAEQDTLSDFIADTCEVGDDLNMPVSELYGMFEMWCRANGESLMHRKLFTQTMRSRGLKYTQAHAGRIWRGIARRSFRTPSAVEGATGETPRIHNFPM